MKEGRHLHVLVGKGPGALSPCSPVCGPVSICQLMYFPLLLNCDVGDTSVWASVYPPRVGLAVFNCVLGILTWEAEILRGFTPLPTLVRLCPLPLHAAHTAPASWVPGKATVPSQGRVVDCAMSCSERCHSWLVSSTGDCVSQSFPRGVKRGDCRGILASF